jgi:hypothetical protein
MLRFYVRLVIAPVLLLASIMGLIRTQPYDERKPIAVLVPVTCRTPCFMGIRPGVTTIDQAILLLKQNDWVRQVIAMPNEIHPNQVGWLWSENAPDYLEKGKDYFDGQLFLSTDRKVSGIGFDTTLKMGDIPPILGNPQQDGLIVAGMVIAPDPRMNVIVELWFPAHHLAVSAIQSCPYYTNFWKLAARVSISAVDARTALRTMPVETVAHDNLVSSLHTLSLQVCGF